MDEEHRQVVALRSLPDEIGDVLLHRLDLGLRIPPGRKHGQHSLLPEEFMIGILRFSQSVSVQEDGVIFVQHGLLLLERHVGDDSQRKVRDNIQHMLGVAHEHRDIVAGIAVTQLSSCKVEDAAEERNEHAVPVHLAHAVVHYLHDASRTILMGRHRAEQASCDSHHQRGGHPLA